METAPPSQNPTPSPVLGLVDASSDNAAADFSTTLVAIVAIVGALVLLVIVVFIVRIRRTKKAVLTDAVEGNDNNKTEGQDRVTMYNPVYSTSSMMSMNHNVVSQTVAEQEANEQTLQKLSPTAKTLAMRDSNSDFKNVSKWTTAEESML